MQNKITLKNVILALQHLIAMFGATVLVPLITGFDPAVALFAAGIGTLIFHFCTKKIVPVFLGSSFAFIGVILAVKEMHGGDLAYAQGGLIVAGLVYVLVSLFIGKVKIETLHKFLPPHVIGPMIIVIGLNLVPIAIDMAKGSLFLSGITLITVLSITKFATGFTKQLAILIAVVLGYAVAYFTGAVDFTLINESSILSIPNFTLPKFSLPAILTIVPVVLAVFMEHVGDITVSGAVVGKDFIKDPGLNKTLLGDGIATIVSAFLGGPANTTYGENTSVLALTKNYNPFILRLAAVFAIALALIGKIGAVIRSIPVPVMGGISLVLFSMIALIGVKTIKNNNVKFNIKNNIVMASILIIGLVSNYLNHYFNMNIGLKITDSVSLTTLSLAAIVGVTLNLVLNYNTTSDSTNKLKKAS